ncbi:MAG: glycosyltransferase, partial [Thermofilaceae archaeon]
MLRIAFVLANPMYPDVVGGAEIFTYTMAYTFAKKGIEAHVVAFGGSKFKSFRSGNLHWHAVRINLKRLRTIIFTIKIIKILFKIKPDVCLAIMGQSSIPCLVYSRLTGKPTFIRLAGGEFAAAFKDIRIYNLSRRIYNKLIIKILKNYYIIALNKEVFEVLRKISKHTYLIPNPIDNIFFQANPDITGYTVIYVGAFRNDKNLLLLI